MVPHTVKLIAPFPPATHMSNLGSLLKTEITRLARKEVKAQTDQLRKANTTYRREIADLKRQMAALSKQVKAAGGDRASALNKSNERSSTRFVAKGLKSLRARLGLSASDFGKLAGVSGQSIYNWENGKTAPRPSQLAILATLRSIGKREAQARIEKAA
jgi:DNA-binding transcriptional regulator YiaG